MIAPAVTEGSSPISRATPMSPIPRVPATVQELPIETATTRQIRQAVE